MVKIHIIFIWMVLFFSFYSYGQDIAEKHQPLGFGLLLLFLPDACGR